MTDVLIIILSTVFVLSVVVTIHELGHYWAARACGVAIDCFSLGFGPPLVSWRDKHGVEWRIASIPLGGYVRFLGDENAASVPDQDNLEAMRAPIVTRKAAMIKMARMKFDTGPAAAMIARCQTGLKWK